MLQFDPNDQKPPFTPEWATYIPGRRRGGDFKIHKGVGQAKCAILYHGKGIIYHFEDDRWVEKFRMEGRGKRPDHCEVCNKNLVVPYRTGHTVWRKGQKGEDFTLITTCYRCP